MPVISTDKLTKRFGRTLAVDRITLRVNDGEIYGFLGLNGAGKTTLIRMLLGMIRPQEGRIRLLDTPVDATFPRWNDIGYLVETPHAYPNLTVRENLAIFHDLRDLRKPEAIDAIIDRLKLGPYRHAKAGVLSLGNKQRLGLAKALMHRPRLLILDEPVNGLDPEGIVEVRELLRQLASEGTTIFLSSHILGEIDKLAGRIGIIHQGRLVNEVTTAALRDSLRRELQLHTRNNKGALDLLVRHGYEARLADNGEIRMTDPTALESPEVITALLARNDLPPGKVYLHTEDLEHFFLRTIHPS